MLYLLDANILINANNSYYPIGQVPEFWSWLRHQGETGQVKIPREIFEEIQAGRKDGDSLLDWIADAGSEAALLLDEDVDPNLVQRVVVDGYASDLTDVEVEKLGRDPFLIAYGLANVVDRCVVTAEVSAAKKQRQNKRIPDACRVLLVPCCGPFDLNRALGFSTAWNR